MAADEFDPTFETLLDYLKRTRGFDFSGYKRASLQRRIDKRMQTVGVDSYAAYTDYLEVHPDEFAPLFNTILINVTAFFRDPLAWEEIAGDIVPRILARKKNGEPIRVWCAGCASGEEAYSVAILLAEALGPDAFRERVKVYGTDVDEEALAQARQGAYPARDLEGVSAELRAKYFEPVGERFAFRKDLRRGVIFGRHDLMQDAPISRLDLLVCRNVLMYFNADAQARIIDRFHFAVNDGGFLFLGKAELMLGHTAAFAPVDLKRRVFAKVGGPPARLWPLARGPADAPAGGPLLNHLRVRDAAFDAGADPAVVIDAQGLLVLANQQARATLGLSGKDLGQPFQDLEFSYRPAELRPHVEAATAEGRAVLVKDVEWRRGVGDLDYLDVHVVPLRENGTVLGTVITFANVTPFKRLQDELQRANHELESAYEELQSTNEELETTNEELQSTVEELETTNEELHSTNEELETMNEELQSANEELQTMNEELRTRSDELNQANAYLESILASLRGAVVVVDRDLLVRVWNHRATDLWGLRPEEVAGKPFLNLDVGLPVADLRQPIRDCLAGTAASVSVGAVNRRGKAITCDVTCTPLRGGVDGPLGAILLMDDRDGGRDGKG